MENLTAEEEALVVATRAYFEAIGRCEMAGGRSQEAIVEAMPAELRHVAESPMMKAMGGLG